MRSGMAGDGRTDGGATAIERYMHEIEAERHAEQFAGEMGRRPDPRRSVAVGAGVRFDERDQVLDRLRRQRRVDREHLGRGDRDRDRVEVPVRIIGNFAVKAGIDDVGGSVGDEGRVTVRRRLRCPAHADIAARTRHVLDVELFSKTLGQLLCDQPGDHVGLAAGRISNDQAHRPGRIGLRGGDPGYGRGDGGARCQTKKPTA